MRTVWVRTPLNWRDVMRQTRTLNPITETLLRLLVITAIAMALVPFFRGKDRPSEATADQASTKSETAGACQ